MALQIITCTKSTNPKRYRATFSGREAGALGVSSNWSIEVRADDTELARIAIYQGYEHLFRVRIEPITE